MDMIKNRDLQYIIMAIKIKKSYWQGHEKDKERNQMHD